MFCSNLYFQKYETLAVPSIATKIINNAIRQYALQINKIIGCSHYCRVDFRLDLNNNVFLLELNTLPGLTETSLFPKSAKADNISYNELINKIINLAK